MIATVSLGPHIGRVAVSFLQTNDNPHNRVTVIKDYISMRECLDASISFCCSLSVLCGIVLHHKKKTDSRRGQHWQTFVINTDLHEFDARENECAEGVNDTEVHITLMT